MCGITVLLTKSFSGKELNRFIKVLKKNESRGGDSVGISVYNLETKQIITSQYVFSKRGGKLYNWLQDNFKGKLKNKPLLILGHTRATATGSKFDAHPILSDKKRFLMVHNGVIYSSLFDDNINDTINTVNYLDSLNGLIEDNINRIKRDLYTTGSMFVILDLTSNKLYISKLGYNPLQISVLTNKDYDKSILISSTGQDTKFNLHYNYYKFINLNRYKESKFNFIEIDEFIDEITYISTSKTSHIKDNWFYGDCTGYERGNELKDNRNEVLNDIDTFRELYSLECYNNSMCDYCLFCLNNPYEFLDLYKDDLFKPDNYYTVSFLLESGYLMDKSFKSFPDNRICITQNKGRLKRFKNVDSFNDELNEVIDEYLEVLDTKESKIVSNEVKTLKNEVKNKY